MQLVRVDAAHVPLISADTLAAHASTLLTNLFAMLRREPTQESEYAMKCVLRTLSTLHQHVLPYTESVLVELSNKLLLVAKNPSRPHFNHYLFECYCILVRQVHAHAQAQAEQVVQQFEAALFPPFQHILQMDVLEFQPYVFQILSELPTLLDIYTVAPRCINTQQHSDTKQA